ncbi:MAG: serine hydrolase domain-containing protein [Planctomycetota bacterium]
MHPAAQPLTDLLLEGVTAGLHPGAQLCVTRHGQPLLDLAVGDNGRGQPMTPDTLVLWMSSGKPLTAVAIAQLVEAGHVELDMPIADLLLDFGSHGKDGITLRHALNHTAGIRPNPFTYVQDDWDTIQSKIAAMRPERDWVPGEKAGYHVQSTWFVLGEVVRIVTGQPLPEYLREHVFLPLGMTDCWLGMDEDAHDDLRHAGRIASTHWLDPKANVGGRTPVAPALRPSDMTERDWLIHCRPGGNAIGPVHQFVRFYEALLPDTPTRHDPAGTRDGVTILQPDTVEQFTAATRVGMHDHTFRFIMDWGLGFMRSNNRYASPAQLDTVPYTFGPHTSDDAFGHSGHQSSAAFADPAHGLAVALVFNGMPGEPDHARRSYRLLDQLYQSLGLAPPATPPAPEPPTPSPAP